MNKMNIPWPGKNDKAFVEGVLGPTQAYIEYFKYSMDDTIVADGFKEAADSIVNYTATGKHIGYPDKLFFPVAYLYRHGLEIYLKYLINDGIDLDILEKDDKIEKLLKSHNLRVLWNQARTVLEKFWPNGDPDDLVAVENIVLQFHQLDKSGQKLRYLKDKNGNPQLQNAPSHVDVKELKKVAAGLFNFMKGCCAGLDDAKEWYDRRYDQY